MVWPLELLHLSTHPEQTERLGYHVAPLGVSRRDDVQDLIQDVYQLRVAALLCDVNDFPRLWKPLVHRLRSSGIRSASGLPELPVLLLRATEPEFDEAAKASHFGASVIVGRLSERRVMAHVLTLLRRFAGGGRSHGRVVPSDADELSLLCTHPTRLALIAGEVLDISSRGVSFAPYDLELAAELSEGTAIGGCSLRVGGHIVDLACTVRRSSLEDNEPSLGLEFDDLPTEVVTLTSAYLDARPERELARRLATD